MLGSLTYYRRLLNENIFNPTTLPLSPTGIEGIIPPHEKDVYRKLPTVGHGIAGLMAGATVSFVAAPVEHIKARLQVQYAVDKSKRLYSGPINCAQTIVCRHTDQWGDRHNFSY
jgi:solute carrier family 25 carnitine/acylcarnitine transporter 20/29